MTKIKVFICSVIWAIMAHAAIKAKSKIAETGYPVPPIPGTVKYHISQLVKKLANFVIEEVMSYLYYKKDIGVKFTGINVNGDSRKEVINEFLNEILGNDFLGFLQAKEGLLLIVHGTMDGKVYFRYTNEASAQCRDPKEVFQFADNFIGGLEKRFLVSCYNGTKNQYFGQWNIVCPTNTPISIIAIDDGTVLVMGLPAPLTQMLGLPIA